MKPIITLFCTLLAGLAQAQLTITPNASLYFNGTSAVTLENMSFVNNGFFHSDSSVVTFSGIGNTSISGTGDITFCRLHIVKDGEVILQRPISVVNRIVFFEGNLFIDNHNVDLGRTGIIDDEGETERIRTTGTGQVIAVRRLNGVVNADPGNLGLSITSAANLGDVTVRRGHLAQSGTGLTTSIFRYYDVTTELAQTNINAELRLRYLDAELNNQSEQILQVYQSTNNTSWTSLGATSNNTQQNSVSITGAQSLGRLTLAGPSVILPVQFVNIAARCEGNKTTITWETAQEINSLHFDVQRNDGNSWTSIGIIPAAGNSNTPRFYSYQDNRPLNDATYRIVEKSIDGRLQYSPIVHISCGSRDGFRLWPNPATSQVNLHINSSTSQQLRLRLYDVKGALIKEQVSNVQNGANSLPINISGLPAGLFTISVMNTNGQRVYSSKFIKK